jgi:hypothetical protein
MWSVAIHHYSLHTKLKIMIGASLQPRPDTPLTHYLAAGSK